MDLHNQITSLNRAVQRMNLNDDGHNHGDDDQLHQDIANLRSALETMNIEGAVAEQDNEGEQLRQDIASLTNALDNVNLGFDQQQQAALEDDAWEDIEVVGVPLREDYDYSLIGRLLDRLAWLALQRSELSRHFGRGRRHHDVPHVQDQDGRPIEVRALEDDRNGEQEPGDGSRENPFVMFEDEHHGGRHHNSHHPRHRHSHHGIGGERRPHPFHHARGMHGKFGHPGTSQWHKHFFMGPHGMHPGMHRGIHRSMRRGMHRGMPYPHPAMFHGMFDWHHAVHQGMPDGIQGMQNGMQGMRDGIQGMRDGIHHHHEHHHEGGRGRFGHRGRGRGERGRGMHHA